MDLANEHKMFSKPIIMNKNILRNFKYLQQLGRKATGDTKVKVDQIIDLYGSRQISQMQTSENVIMKLLSKDSKTQQAGLKLFDKVASKHVDVAPLSHRLRHKTTVRVESKFIKNVNVGDTSKAKTDITLEIHEEVQKDKKR